MYKKLCFLMIFVLTLTGCKGNTEMVIPCEVSNQMIQSLSNKSEQGVYEFSSSKKQVIIYRGIETGVKSMSYSIKNHVLTVSFVTEKITKPKNYSYKIKNNTSYDTLNIIVDGKETPLITVFCK